MAKSLILFLGQFRSIIQLKFVQNIKQFIRLKFLDLFRCVNLNKCGFLFLTIYFYQELFNLIIVKYKSQNKKSEIIKIIQTLLNNLFDKHIINSMFNNLQASNILGTSYLAGNVCFSSTQDQIIYCPIANSVKYINLQANQSQILPFQTPHQIKNIIIGKDSIVMIAIDMVGYAVVFNLKGMFIIAQYNFKGPVIAAQFSQDGKLFAVAQEHGFIVYQAPNIYRTFQPFVLIKKYKNRHSSNICSIRFSPDSRFLLTAGEDNIIYMNNLFPVKDYIAVQLQVHRYKIIGLYFSSSMKYIYSIDSGSNIYVWKWVNDHLTQQYKNMISKKKRKLQQLRGNSAKKIKLQNNNQENEQDQQQDIHLQHYSEFEKQVNIGRFILAKKLIVTQQGEYLKRVYYNPQNGFLTAAYSKGKFSIFKLVQQELTDVQSFSVGQNKISTLAVNPSCTWICLGLKTYGQIIVWEWKSQSYILNQKGFIHQTNALAFNNHKIIATGTSEGKVKLWDKKSGFCLSIFQQHESSITDLKFSNKNTLFSSSLDGSVNAYDIVKYKKFRKFKPDTQCQITCLEVDESDDIIFAGSFDPYQVFSWSVQTGNILQIIRGHQSPISCIKMAGQQLITGSWDRSLKIHQIFARKLNVQTFDHSSQITALAVHPNRKQVAASTMKGQIYIWNVQQGNLVGIIDSQITGGRSYFSKISAQNDKSSKYLKCLQYSPCGNYLFGGGKSKYLMIYDIQHRMLLQKICLTKSKDLQGTIQKLNSRYVKEGVSTYQMSLEQQENDSQDENYQKLPGSKKLDISQIRKKLQVQVKKIVILNAKQLAVNTSFGVLILSPLSSRRQIFNPYELTPNLTPALLPQLFDKKQYSSFLLVGLKLNLDIRKLLKKIPIQYMNQTISQLDQQKRKLVIKLLSERDMTYRQLNWVQKIIQRYDYRQEQFSIGSLNLRASIQCLQDQVHLMSRNSTILEMGQLFIYHPEQLTGQQQ